MKRFMGLAIGSFSLIAISCFFAPQCQAEHASMVSVTARPAAVPGNIQWHNDLASGWKAAKLSGRPMVIFITSANCRYCDAMKLTTWSDSGIRNRIAGDFIAIRLSPDRNSSELSRVRVQMYPTTIVALAEGKVVDHREGFQPSANLHQLLDRVHNRFAR